MNKRISLFLFILGILIAACTPKAGDKAAGNKTVAASGQSPTIPVPSGDVRSKAPKAGNAPKIQIGKAETFTLDNGLKVIVVENHKLPTVSYQVFVDSDPVLERDAAGNADLMGELLMKGTSTRTKAQIDGEVDFIGASLSTSNNGATGRCLSKHSDKLLAILSDVVMHPAFPQEELDKAKTRAQANLAQQKDDADQIADNVGSVLAYGSSHPYGEIMTEETLAKINLEQIKKHYSTFFKPNISYLVVVGDVTKSQAEKYAKKYFGAWQRGDAPAQPHPAPRAPEKSQVSFVHKPGAVQSVINITYPVDLKPGTTEAIRARIANAVLGGYFNSRVNANLREGHGWTYGARTGITPDELVGIFSGTASVRNAVTDSSIIEFLKEMDRMRTEKVGADELQVVKNVLAGSFSQSLEQPGTVASFALNTARFGLPADFYEKYLETLQGITADEVLMAAKKYIRPDRAHIVIVGNRDDVADRVKQFSADGKISYYDAFGKPVRNLNRNIPAGMTAEKVIEDYVNAIGGAAKIAEIKDLKTTAAMETRGPKFGLTTWQKGGNKIKVEMTSQGNVMSLQLYDGMKGSQSGMGMPATPIEGKDLADIKEQASFCKEAGYKNGYTLALLGIDEVNGVSAYAIEVTRPDGAKSTEYYDVKTSLKLREVRVMPAEGEQGPTTQTIDFSDYKAENGVLMPHLLNMTGIFPVPLKVIISEVKVNAGVEDDVFKM